MKNSSMTDYDPKIIQKALESRIHEYELLDHRNLKTKRLMDLKDEWFYFAFSYLQASSTLIKYAIENNSIYGKVHIIPAVYNFRHAIELSLKSLFKFTNKRIEPSHDISVLYESVLDSLKKHSGFKVREFIASDESTKLTKKELDKSIANAIDDLTAIINKYYFQTPLQKNLKSDSFFIEDHNNELFKYPEAKNVTFYFQSTSMLNIPDSDLKLIMLDIEKTIFIMNLFFTLFNPKSKE